MKVRYSLGAAFIATLLLSSGATGQSSVPPAAIQAEPSAAEWRAAARKDVLAAYDIYKTDHPGMLDPTNKPFAAFLEKARATGLAATEKVTDRATYSLALAAFSGELNDGHAQAYAKPVPAGQAQPQNEWPGFIAAWRGGKVLVHHASATSPLPVGSVIQTCDGFPVKTMIERRLLPRYFRPQEAGQWWFRTFQAFLSTPASAATRPQNCRAVTPNGRERQVKLPWSPAPDNLNPLTTAASDGQKTPIGLSEPRPGVFLIGLPDFQPDGAGVEAYKELFESVARRREELSSARALVLDMRYNNGGSGQWSMDLGRLLWGKDDVDAAMDDYFAGVEVWWRPTQGTADTMKAYAERLRKEGKPDRADRQVEFISRLSAAHKRGEAFVVEPWGEGPIKKRVIKPRKSSFKAPVYVITPGRCASACLDALDVFTRFEGVKRIGAPTSGDTTYMEIRIADLPSGYGALVVPMKIWMQRPRGRGEVYQPHIRMDALDWSTASFLDRIERDLTGKRQRRR